MTLERELETYKRVLPSLLEDEGRFAVVHEDEVAGVFDTYEDALKIAYEKFGLQPFLVKQIRALEQVHCLTRDVVPCHT